MTARVQQNLQTCSFKAPTKPLFPQQVLEKAKTCGSCWYKITRKEWKRQRLATSMPRQNGPGVCSPHAMCAMGGSADFEENLLAVTD